MSASSTPQNVYRYTRPTASPRGHTGKRESELGSPYSNNNNNIGKETEGMSDSCSLSPLSSSRRRYYSGSVVRPPSILNGIRDLVMRPRSESFGASAVSSLKKGLMRRNQQRVDSEFDVREAEEAQDLYGDELSFRPRSNSSDLVIMRKTSRPLTVDVVGSVDSTSDAYRQYMQVVDCYELAPPASTVIAIDREMKVGKAFAAVYENKVGAGLVWDSTMNKVISIVSWTDFLVYLQNESASEDGSVNEILSSNQLVVVPSNTKLLDACEEFISNQVHRIAVVDEWTGDVMYLLTIKRVLQAIHRQNRSLHFAQWLSMSIRASGVGKWDRSITTVSTSSTLSTVINCMLGHRLSSLPVLNEEGIPVDVICKSDLATALRGISDAQAFFSSCTVEEALSRSGRSRAIFAYENDQVSKMLDILLSTHHSRCIFILNSLQSIVASVSLSDILRYLLYTNDTRPPPSPLIPSTTVFNTPSSMCPSPQPLSPLYLNVESS
ncbi:aakg-5 [Pristionchus pacificus]|uniref:Aakg-5 n=1 Tax=Pristionchus pacificus TaxID=54126 RepID=A0A2A6B7I9_PRIPA|nr:aakg-5 [Pristionchus pacificus]|eukprot:PDM61831.1 aakg-5 [Pristionchus pacificus]